MIKKLQSSGRHELNKSLDGLVFPPHSDPYFLQFPEWTVLWWKWLLSIPRECNPASDSTGKFCDKSQHNPNVWFLAGTLGGSAIRNCTIPYGRAILFPLITSEFSLAQDRQLKCDEDLIRAVTADMDTVDRLSLTINKISFDQLNQYRVRSKPFDCKIEGVETMIVSDGFWIFLKPLDIGDYSIYFMGQNIDFFNEVTYHISITSEHQG